MNTQASSSPQNKPMESMHTWPNLLAGAGACAETGWGRGLDGLRARELSLVMHLLLAVLVLFPVFNSYMKRGPGNSPSTPIFFPGFPPEMKVQVGDGKRKGAGSGGARYRKCLRVPKRRTNSPTYHALAVPSRWLETGPLVVLESFARVLRL